MGPKRVTVTIGHPGWEKRMLGTGIPRYHNYKTGKRTRTRNTIVRYDPCHLTLHFEEGLPVYSGDIAINGFVGGDTISGKQRLTKCRLKKQSLEGPWELSYRVYRYTMG